MYGTEFKLSSIVGAYNDALSSRNAQYNASGLASDFTHVNMDSRAAKSQLLAYIDSMQSDFAIPNSAIEEGSVLTAADLELIDIGDTYASNALASDTYDFEF